MADRQGTEQDGIDQAEDCNVCADAQCQRKNSNYGENRALMQRPQRVPNILESGFEQMQSTLVAALLLNLRDAADRKSTRLNSSHVEISYAVFCLKKKRKKQ